MILGTWFGDLSDIVNKHNVFNFLVSLLILLVGTFIAGRSRMAVQRLSQLDEQQRLIFTKVAYYGLLSLTIAATLSQLGIDLKVILGAAGVLTVAVGFAAQTSASNLISGLFLMVERPFVVGDVVGVGDTRGEVMSIDLLSSKIRTFSNLMVRIPNEKLVKSDIVNYSYFPVRRLDFTLGISFRSDIDQVERVLRTVATTNTLCLEDPSPVFILSGFGESTVNIQFQVWTLSGNLTRLQNELYRDIKVAFDQHSIDLPFPTRTVYSIGVPAGSGAV